MLHLELPHVNVLSKIDLVRQYGQLGESPEICLSKDTPYDPFNAHSSYSG